MTKIAVLNAIYNSNLQHRAISVARYLLDRANADLSCFPSVKTIAKDLKLSTRTVQRALNDLVEAGYIKKEERFRENGGQSSNLFTFIIDDKNQEDETDKTDDKNTSNEQYASEYEYSINESKCNNEDNSDINKTVNENFDYIDFSNYIENKTEQQNEFNSVDDNYSEFECFPDYLTKPYQNIASNDFETGISDFNRTNMGSIGRDIGVKCKTDDVTDLNKFIKKDYSDIICHRGYANECIP